ncbi:MAG: hypothetical protein IKL82_06335 [Clostridia bacterium]|nr:hypothetical protein [Clostridia bacterium]
MKITDLTAIIDGKSVNCAEVTYLEGRTVIRYKKELFKGAKESVQILKNAFTANVGSDGYYLGGNYFMRYSAFLTYFKEREDFCYKEHIYLMKVFGYNHGGNAFIGVMTGMPGDASITVEKEGDLYRLYLQYDLKRIDIYEDIVIELLEVDPALGYVGMAKRYRKYQFEERGVKTLKQKIKERPVLDYVKDSIEIRIRQGWKPAPPTVLEQTLENEPPMKVVTTFDRVKDLVDEMKKQGVEKAEICLVGWNVKGHDGRWPDAFPVEEDLGGEEKLKELIAYAQKNGYLIVCHSNSTDCYHISKKWNDGFMCSIQKSGENRKCAQPWSGGNMYSVCPQIAYENSLEMLPEIAKLGFKGAHYIDVITINQANACFSENHPVNGREAIEYYNKIGRLSQNLFGAFSSEGSFDDYAPSLDVGLYVQFGLHKRDGLDEGVPFWEITYHGSIMANQSNLTVNYTLKTPLERVQEMAYNARPSFYINSKFYSGKPVCGEDDLIIGTNEELVTTVSHLKRGYDEYKKLSALQVEFIEDFEKLTEEVHKITYSNGTVIYANYSSTDYTLENGTVLSKQDYLVK